MRSERGERRVGVGGSQGLGKVNKLSPISKDGDLLKKKEKKVIWDFWEGFCMSFVYFLVFWGQVNHEFVFFFCFFCFFQFVSFGL